MNIPNLPKRNARYLLNIATQPGATVELVVNAACANPDMPYFKINNVCSDIYCSDCLIGERNPPGDMATLLLALKALAEK